MQKVMMTMEMQNNTLDDVASVIGFTATVRLAAWFGENKVHVPLKVEDGQLLVNLLGRRLAELLTQNWPGEMLTIPRLQQYDFDLRRRQIGRLLMGRFTPREISHWFGLSERRVQQICRELEVAGLIPPVAPLVKAALEKEHHKRGGRKPVAKTTTEKSDGKTTHKKGRSKTV